LSPGARETVRGGAGKPARRRRGAALAPDALELPLAPAEPVPDGAAVVYAEGAFGTPSGKTAHGLVRRSRGTIEWDGKQRRMYHYVMTLDFPYAVACYRGSPIEEADGLALGAPDSPLP